MRLRLVGSLRVLSWPGLPALALSSLVLVGAAPAPAAAGAVASSFAVPVTPPRDPPPTAQELRSQRDQCTVGEPTSDAELAAEWKRQREALARARAAGDRRCEGRALEGLAQALLLHHERHAALDYQRAALAAFDAARAGSDLGILALLQQVAGGLSNDDPVAAVGVRERALSALLEAARRPDPPAPLCPRSGRLDDDDWHLRYRHETQLGEEEVGLRTALSWDLRRLGRHDEARDHLRAALQVVAAAARRPPRPGDPSGSRPLPRAGTAAQLAADLQSVHEAAPQLPVDLTDFTLAAELAAASDHPWDRLRGQRVLAEVQLRHGDPLAARATLERALDGATSADRSAGDRSPEPSSSSALEDSERQSLERLLVEALALVPSPDRTERLARSELPPADLVSAVMVAAVTLADAGEGTASLRFLADAAPALPPQQRAEIAYLRSRVLVLSGDPLGAEATLRAALAESPDDHLRARQLARLVAEQGRWQEAERSYLALAQRAPADRDLLWELASFYERDQRWADAARWTATLAESYRSGEPSAPHSLRPTLLRLADLAGRAGDAATAAAALAEADALTERQLWNGEPNHRDLAALARARGELEVARRHHAAMAKDAAESPFHRAMVALDRAELEVDAGEVEEARGYLAEALELAVRGSVGQGSWEAGALARAGELHARLGEKETAAQLQRRSVAVRRSAARQRLGLPVEGER